MTVQLLALYKQPGDTAAFDDHYFNVHAKLAEKMPGLVKAEYKKITGAPFGKPGFYLLAELTFADQAALTTALNSSEGRDAAKDLMGFAGNLVQLMFAEPVQTPAEIA